MRAFETPNVIVTNLTPTYENKSISVNIGLFLILGQNKQQRNLSVLNTICEIVKMDNWTHNSVEFLCINFAIGAFFHPLSKGIGGGGVSYCLGPVWLLKSFRCVI